MAGAKRILVVDDEELVRGVMRTVLAAAGFEVVEAAGGEEAIQKYSQSSPKFDLVLLDQQMPRMSGPETLAHLRQRDPLVKAVLLSGGLPDNEVEKALAGARLRFLLKPFVNQELVGVVRQALDN